MENWVNGEVVLNKKWNFFLFSLFIKAEIKNFVPGQFTKLGININGKFVQRAYSYVNSNYDKFLEFYIALIEGGKLSPVLRNLKKGDRIYLSEKSYGFLTLSNIPKYSTVWMISTGTAIGPFLSILRSNVKDALKFKRIIFINAVRYLSDLSYSYLLKEIKEIYKDQISIEVITSREVINGFLEGRIPELIKNGELEKKVCSNINSKDSYVMICGNPGMIRDTLKVLKDFKDFDINSIKNRRKITVERYW